MQEFSGKLITGEILTKLCKSSKHKIRKPWVMYFMSVMYSKIFSVVNKYKQNIELLRIGEKKIIKVVLYGVPQ